MRHLTTLFDLTPADVMDIFETAEKLKTHHSAREVVRPLENRVVTLIFDKPSLRTRLSFEAAIAHLGGSASFFTAKDAGLYGRESLPDVARVVSGYSDAIVLRTFSHKTVEDFVEWSSCPIVNGLSDDYHPCQALTDLFTIREVFGALTDEKLVFVGDGNNVAASLAILCTMLEMPFTLCCPAGYEIPEATLTTLKERYPAAKVTQTNDIDAALNGADVVYTDVWASMGQEEEADERKAAFAPFQVNAELMAKAPADCRFMHDLPARRGLEVTDEVMDGKGSIVFQQAENRMHLAKGLLAWLLKQDH
ncbi:MAG: ornithine carbamoyltransferase [Planctomycetota bacterium]|jgi:ornithine carbamoyltransferase